MLIGRLATDLNWEKQGIGSGLLKDAILRILQVATIARVKAILVHAGEQKAKDFYTKLGFKESPLDPMTLMIALKDIKESLL